MSEAEQHVPCVVYAAKSTEDVRGSIATQVADCRTALERRGGVLYAEPQTDEGRSAFHSNRGPGLARAKALVIEAARKHGAAELWVQHSDRIARGDGVVADHLAEVFFLMRRAGVRLRSVQDDAFLQDVIHIALMGERNNEDSRRKSAAVKAGKQRQFERGEVLGGPPPDGYIRVREIDPSGKVVARFELDPERTSTIVRLFELAASGLADANVMRALNREGLRTRGGLAWSRRQVQNIVTNPVFAGRIARHRSRPAMLETRPGRHAPLVDPQVFDDIQRSRRTRDRGAGSNRRPGRPNSRHLLAGLARCARCKELMRPIVSPYRRKDGTQRRTYVCRHKTDCTGLCDQPPLDAELIDGAVASHLEGFILDFGSWVKAITDHRNDARKAVEGQIMQVEGQLSRLAQRERRLAADYALHIASGNEQRAEIASLALGQDREAGRQLSAELRSLKGIEAQTADDAGDAVLDFYNELRAALSGVLGSGQPLLEINTELRQYFSGFLLDRLPDGRTAVWPLLRQEAAESMWAAIPDRLDKLSGPFPTTDLLVL